MSDRHHREVGIRLRDQSGRKWAVPGSRNALLWSGDFIRDPLIVAEGPSDAAAALALGFDAIGRASAKPGRAADLELAEVVRGRGVAVLADRDQSGVEGAEVAVHHLMRTAAEVRVLTPPAPHKDLRQALGVGLTRPQLLRLIEAADPVRVCLAGAAV